MSDQKEEKETPPQKTLHHDHHNDKQNVEQQQQQQQQQQPLFLPTTTSSPSTFSPFDFEQVSSTSTSTSTIKRPRYTTSAPQPIQPQWTQQISTGLSPTQSNPQAQLMTSPDTSSSPSLSPIPSSSSAQFRKGKYVSPVWKPNEMLWLAKAWRAQYQGDGPGYGPGTESGSGSGGRGKTRAEKDKEVAEFLSRNGVSRDAKTAGTKWDNMLGEFRKVYEWERGGERDQIGKSYFRLSPYERKIHRLPASFDEQVFEELSQFMGPRMRPTSSSSVVGVTTSTSSLLHFQHGLRSSNSATDFLLKALPPTPPPLPPPFRDEDFPLSNMLSAGMFTYANFLI